MSDIGRVMQKLLDKLDRESQLDRVETESSRAGDAVRLKVLIQNIEFNI